MILSEKTISQLIRIVTQAGESVMSLYNDCISIQNKSDSSPITEADRSSHEILLAGLRSITSHIPVFSEESEIPIYEERSNLSEFWLVDPLDGTKEFIAKNDEFTINIALLKRFSSSANKDVWKPIFGLVYVPASDEAYIGWTYDDMYDNIMPGEAYFIHKLSTTTDYWRKNSSPLNPIKRIDHVNLPLRIVASKSHFDSKTDSFIQKIKDDIGEIETVKLGSSLKLCKIASGYAHAYPRFAPSMEWDIAAAHAVCRASGVSVIDIDTQELLEYNKKELVNSGIFVTAIPTLIDFLCAHTN